MFSVDEVKKFGRFKGRNAVRDAWVLPCDRKDHYCKFDPCYHCLRNASNRLLRIQTITDDYTVKFLWHLRGMSSTKRRKVYKAFLLGKREGIQQEINAIRRRKRKALP